VNVVFIINVFDKVYAKRNVGVPKLSDQENRLGENNLLVREVEVSVDMLPKAL